MLSLASQGGSSHPAGQKPDRTPTAESAHEYLGMGSSSGDVTITDRHCLKGLPTGWGFLYDTFSHLPRNIKGIAQLLSFLRPTSTPPWTDGEAGWRHLGQR